MQSNSQATRITKLKELRLKIDKSKEKIKSISNNLTLNSNLNADTLPHDELVVKKRLKNYAEKIQNNLINAYEISTVENCYEKSKKLIEIHSKKKKIKDITKSSFTKFYNCEKGFHNDRLSKTSFLIDTCQPNDTKNFSNSLNESNFIFKNKLDKKETFKFVSESETEVKNLIDEDETLLLPVSCQNSEDKQSKVQCKMHKVDQKSAMMKSFENKNCLSPQKSGDIQNLESTENNINSFNINCIEIQHSISNSQNNNLQKVIDREKNSNKKHIKFKENKQKECNNTRIFSMHMRQGLLDSKPKAIRNRTKKEILTNFNSVKVSCTEALNENRGENKDLDVVYIKTQKVFPVINIMDKLSFLYNNSNSSHFTTETEKLKERNQSERLELSNKVSNVENNLSESEVEITETVIPKLDFEEEPIDFEVPILHKDGILIRFSNKDIKAFESKGVSIKSGKWSKKEEALLKRNFENFKTQFGLRDTRMLLGIGRNTNKNTNENIKIKKFLKAKHFYLRLGKDLNQRHLWSIYVKARHAFHPLAKHKTIPRSIFPTISKLRKKYGNKWQLIGQKVGYLPNYCKWLWNTEKKAVIRGKWSSKENQNLITAIQTVSKTTDLSGINHDKIPWSKVAELVESRHSVQCRNHWLTYQDNKEMPGNYEKWDQKWSAKLVYMLQKYNANDETDINWKEIHRSFKNVAPSKSFLIYQWSHSLKPKVPRQLRDNFVNVIDYLYKKYSCTSL